MNGGCTAVRGICCEEALLSLNGAGKIGLTGLGKTPKVGGAAGAAVVIRHGAALRALDGVKQLVLCQKSIKIREI